MGPTCGGDDSVLNVTALVERAATASSVLWIEVPGDRTYAVWHAWLPASPEGGGPAAVVVNGPGEQTLPWLPDEVVLALRSAATRALLLRILAHRTVLLPDDPDWLPAATALARRRQNAPDGLIDRWRSACTITAFAPYGQPLAAPGRHTGELATARVADGLDLTPSPR